MTGCSARSAASSFALLVVVPIVAGLLAAGCTPDMHKHGAAGSASGTAAGSASSRARLENAVDERVIKAFAQLERCGYRAGRLDHRCAELKALRALMRSRQSARKDHGQLTRALAQLLGSEHEVQRLVAADSVFFFHRKPIIVAALWKALSVETSPTVEATLLRQLCWRHEARVEKAARARMLDQKKATVVRAEAANCLGRQRRIDDASRAALRKALASDPSPVVQGNACAALGTVRDADALPDMIGKLGTPTVGWRCATALAHIGGPKAYAALYAACDKATRSGGPMAVQQVSALASFATRPHVKRPRLVALLGRIAVAPKLSWLARKRAARELGILGARAVLQRVARHYAKAKSGDDALVAKAVQSALKQATAQAAARKARVMRRRRRRSARPRR